MIYYVDSDNKGEKRSGLSPSDAVSSWRDLCIRPGDTVLFRRGSFFRDSLLPPDGEKDAVIRFGAYGEGKKPVFCGSKDLSSPDLWIETRRNEWKCAADLESEACNLIFDGGRSCGVLAWEPDGLDSPGKWHYTGIGNTERRKRGGACDLFLYSEGNPGRVFGSIECALYGNRRMASARAYVEFSDLAFINSGVHGFAATSAVGITMRNCDFSFIGGCVWNRERKIRFGNAFELWDGARDVTMEGCRCFEIYDSCYTHQGPDDRGRVPENLICRGNVFEKYGMAAYEARGLVPRGAVFSDNICLDAGVGFSLQDETPPRRSEIWPQPMGHHVFLWHTEHGTEGGRVEVTGNYFGRAPYGGAIYDIVSDEARAQFIIKGNRYSPSSDRMLDDEDGESV
ncbi:MAG: hypothetical protein J6Z80_00885 [Clostridia bacterium]|nr:hypothetical protein [Clostridia bacterium]